MHLITLAHRGEASAFLNFFKAESVSGMEQLYAFAGGYLLITGEGPWEAYGKVSWALGKFSEIQKIYNFGVAGSLKTGQIHELIQVRQVYHYKEKAPDFRSFSLSDEGQDVITSDERILSPEKAQELRPMGNLVDRELWGISFAAKNHGKHLVSYKYISDEAGTLGACELVKELASEASEKFLKTYLAHTTPANKETEFNLSGFHFTFFQEQELKNLLKKLQLSLTDLNLQSLIDLKISPKDRSKRLLHFLREKLDPIGTETKNELDKLFASFKEQGLKVYFDPHFEDKKLKFEFEAANSEDHEEKLLKLRELPWKKYQELLQGKFHVE